jgi:hypothetical protein
MQQWLTPIKPDAGDPEALAIVEEISHDGPRQLRAWHEITTISASLAPQIAVRGQRYEDFFRVGLNDLRQKVGCRVFQDISVESGRSNRRSEPTQDSGMSPERVDNRADEHPSDSN